MTKYSIKKNAESVHFGVTAVMFECYDVIKLELLYSVLMRSTVRPKHLSALQ